MRRFIRWIGQAMLLVLVGALAARAAPAGESVTAPLQGQPLDSGNQVISKSDGNSKARLIGNGVVCVEPWVEFNPIITEYGLRIAGQKVAIVTTADGFAVKGDAGQVTLHQNGMGLGSVALPISGAQKYFLAFPYGRNSGGRGMMMVRSGGTVQCQIDGQSVMFYDDNLDGRYTMADDAFRVGGVDAPIDVFAPISPFFSTGRSIYKIDKLAEDGTTLQYSPYHGAAGKLAVNCNSSEFGILVALCNSAAQMNLVGHASASTADALAVIPGKYKLLYGGAYSRKTGTLLAVVMPGTLPPVEVAADQTQTLQLGGTLNLEFVADKQENGKISINPGSFHLRGKAGEEYAAYSFARSTPPEIYISRGDKKVLVGKMGFG